MAEISRALASKQWDRAFVLAGEYAAGPHRPLVAAAFLVESGVPVEELPRGAQRALVEAAAG